MSACSFAWRDPSSECQINVGGWNDGEGRLQGMNLGEIVKTDATTWRVRVALSSTLLGFNVPLFPR